MFFSKFSQLFIVVASLLSAQLAIGQEKGFLRGNITDGDFGGPMIGATIVLADNPGVGTITDFDGNFSLSLDPGTYTVNISYISYATQSFADIVITEGEVTPLDATLKSAIDELDVVEVVAEARRNTENGVLLEMKNASAVQDGLSSQSIKKVGDSDLSGAIKRVTGVTVQGGKYVYVRGLGDRYTKTTLNGLAIPGLDPDVNAVQIDIFPTAILENVNVLKSFTPNEYGDFTGGLVNIVTKKFPEQKETQVSLGLGYVQGQTFNSDYILYNRGGMDWLGFDDGMRELPIDQNTVVPVEVEVDPQLETITRSFGRDLAVKSATALPNGSLSLVHGNQLNKESGTTYGYNFVLNYQNQTNFYKDFESNAFLKDNDNTVNELFQDESRIGDVGVNTVQWSAMASGSMKKEKYALTGMLLRSQSGETTASDRIVRNFNQTGAILQEYILTYSQRSLSTFLLDGNFNLGKLQLDVAGAVSKSRVYDPDFRSTAYSLTNGSPTLNPGDGAGINRFWRDLNEWNENFRADATYTFSKQFKLKAGANILLKQREFETIAYIHSRRNRSDVDPDPDWFLQEDNIWTSDDRSGTYTIGNQEPINNFEARQNVMAGYLMAEHQITPLFRAIYGLRVEKGDMFYTGEGQVGLDYLFYNDEKTLDELNFLPSVNLVYAVTEKTNIRGSVTQTIARPSFKEKSIAQIYDPITKRTFIGNIDLEQTEITNYDLRYEWFFGPREILSVAGFYKQFDGHIELVSFETAPDNIKPRNSGDAFVYGIELEARKQLGFIPGKFFDRLFLGGNVTLVESGVDMKQVQTGNEGQTEYDLRTTNLRVGETLDDTRDMAGQSPYSINANLSYEIVEKQFNVSLAYNVQGEQLSIIASGRIPDVYTKPFHSFDFNSYIGLGKEMRSKLSFGIRNLLDDKREMVYKSFGAEDEIYQAFSPGRTFNLKYTYTF